MNVNVKTPLLGEDKERTQKNIEALVASKGRLIRKACGASTLTVKFAGGTVTFSLGGIKKEMLPAAMELMAAVGLLAARSKWISAREKPVENERYAFRAFLNRCDMGGDAHKEARTALLSNLSGDAAYAHGRPVKRHTGGPVDPV